MLNKMILPYMSLVHCIYQNKVCSIIAYSNELCSCFTIDFSNRLITQPAMLSNPSQLSSFSKTCFPKSCMASFPLPHQPLKSSRRCGVPESEQQECSLAPSTSCPLCTWLACMSLNKIFLLYNLAKLLLLKWHKIDFIVSLILLFH